jgi:dTDP-glucose 4,6-dehydratase
MIIIVTGGAGFIGPNFIYHMLKKYPDYRIVCIDCLTYAGNMSTLKEAMENPNFHFCRINICDRLAIYQIFEKEHPDIVINFAAESHVDRSIENPEVFLQTNILGTQVLMDACRKFGIIRYHQISTDEVYGDLPLDRPDLFFTETTPIHTSSPYSASKASADLLVPPYIRFACDNQPQFKQLRSVSLPRKSHSSDDRKLFKRQTVTSLRKGRECSRLAVCRRPLQSNRLDHLQRKSRSGL